MAIPAPDFLIKLIWLVHFALTSWAIMSIYLAGAPAYLFTQMGVLAVGFWAMVSKESVDAALMFLVTLCFSVFNDILLISIYQPRADDRFEKEGVETEYKNEYRWALGMSILNLIMKALSIFLVFAIYRSRSNNSEFNIRLPGFPGQSSSNRPGQSQYTTIESAHDSHPGVHGRPHQYQSPPPQYQSPPGQFQNPPHQYQGPPPSGMSNEPKNVPPPGQSAQI